MKNLYTLLFLIFSGSLFAQVADIQNANWVFGINNLLGFLPTVNASTIPNTLGFDTLEGCASVSDRNGNLILFSDGVRLWQRQSNGTDILLTSQLRGHFTSAQNVIFIPKPNFENRYYVVTISGSGSQTGLYYSEVDLSNATTPMVQTNVQLFDDNSVPINHAYLNKAEALTSTIHADNENYWLVANVMQTGTQSRIFSYRVTETGISLTPDQTTVITVTNNDSGRCLKISPDAGKIALSFFRSGIYSGLFNNATGVVTMSNPILLNSSINTISYGVEFSDDSNVLYFSSADFIINNMISRINLNPTFDLSSLQTVTTNTQTINFGALQRGLDGKIYFPNGTTFSPFKLFVIPSPNDMTIANFVDFTNPFLMIDNPRIGLPQWVWRQSCQKSLNDDEDILANTVVNEQRYDWIRMTNTIEANALGIYHAANFVELLPGFESKNGSQLSAYIQDCTGNFVYRNNGKGYTESTIENSGLLRGFTISPNPSNSFIDLTMTNAKFHKISIVSVDGKMILDREVESTDAYNLDVSLYASGIYLVNVTSTEGKQYSQKLIKN